MTQVKVAGFWSLVNLWMVSFNEEVKEAFECDIFFVVIPLQNIFAEAFEKKHEDPVFQCKNACNISPLGQNLPHIRMPNTKRRLNYVQHVASDLKRRLISMNTKGGFMNRTTTQRQDLCVHLSAAQKKPLQTKVSGSCE